MSLLTGFLEIVETALRNPTDKAAVQIAIDGLAAFKDAAALPSVRKVVADIEAYIATLPPTVKPAVWPGDSPLPAPAHQTPGDFNNDPRNR